MNRLLAAALCALALCAPGLVAAQVVSYTDVTPDGSRITVPVSPSKPLPTTGGGGGGGGGDVNLTQVNGATVNVGTGAAGTGTQRVTTSTDSTIGTVTAVTTITNPVAATQSGAWAITGISGAVSLPTGASTSALQSATQAPTAPATATATTSTLAGCTYTSAGVTFTNGQQGSLSCGASGGLYIAGTVASGATDSGNPVKVGALYTTSLPSLSTGQRGDLQVDQNGTLRVLAVGTSGTGADAGPNTIVHMGSTTSQGVSAKLATVPFVFNGSTFDRPRSIIDATNSTGTGIMATGTVAQCDDTGQVALTENQFGNARISCTNHALLVRPYETSANTWQATVTLSDTTNTAIHASCGAGLRNYVTNLDYSSVATTVADELDLNDNATAIWKANVAAGAAGRSYEWLSPKMGTAATAMNVQLTGSPTGSVIVNASGYCAP